MLHTTMSPERGAGRETFRTEDVLQNLDADDIEALLSGSHHAARPRPRLTRVVNRETAADFPEWDDSLEPDVYVVDSRPEPEVSPAIALVAAFVLLAVSLAWR